MTDDSIEAIRERKRKELAARLEEGEEGDGSEAEAGTPSEPVAVTGADHLDELVSTNRVVLADFYADWCGPCQMMEPAVEAVAADTDALVAKVDVDANQQLAAQYGVRGVPTVVLFVDGEVAEQAVGAQGEERLRDLVDV
ncbi:MAG: thioredoxin [Haloferacaceae archaeon]